MEKQLRRDISVKYIKVSELNPAVYNPRKHDKKSADQLKESITKFGLVDPIIVNEAIERKNIVIGGHFRLEVAKEMGFETIPVVYVNIPDIEKEKELNLRLNKNTGEWDWELLANYDSAFLDCVGFSSEEIDQIFDVEDTPEQFDLQKELEKLNITEINIKKGDIYDLDGSRLMCGDSTNEDEWLKLMDGEKADMCFTDPPYILDYLKAKRHGKAVSSRSVLEGPIFETLLHQPYPLHPIYHHPIPIDIYKRINAVVIFKVCPCRQLTT